MRIHTYTTTYYTQTVNPPSPPSPPPAPPLPPNPPPSTPPSPSSQPSPSLATLRRLHTTSDSSEGETPFFQFTSEGDGSSSAPAPPQDQIPIPHELLMDLASYLLHPSASDPGNEELTHLAEQVLLAAHTPTPSPHTSTNPDSEDDGAPRLSNASLTVLAAAVSAHGATQKLGGSYQSRSLTLPAGALDPEDQGLGFSQLELYTLDPHDVARADGSGELYRLHPASNCPRHEGRRDAALQALQTLLATRGGTLSQGEALRHLLLGHPWADLGGRTGDLAPGGKDRQDTLLPSTGDGDLLVDWVMAQGQAVQQRDGGGSGSSLYRLPPPDADEEAYTGNPHGGNYGGDGGRRRSLQQSSGTESYASLLRLSNVQVLTNGTLLVPRANLTLSLYFENADKQLLLLNLASVNYAKAMVRAGVPVAKLAMAGMSNNSYFVVTGRLTTMDSVPPSLNLVGQPTINVKQFAKYYDPGATALDDLDGDIPRFKVFAWGLPINTSAVGTSTISYYVYDYFGNLGGPITRAVIVYDPCVASGEVMCTETRACSVLGGVCRRDSVLLLTGLATRSTAVGAMPDTDPVYADPDSVVYDTTAPVITLLPLTATRFVTADGRLTGVITELYVNDMYLEPGALVQDDLDANVQDALQRRGHEVIDMSVPTGPDAPYVISYNVRDFSGNRAVSKYRLLYVSCPPGQLRCVDDTTGNLYCAALACGVPQAPGASSLPGRRRLAASDTSPPAPSAPAPAPYSPSPAATQGGLLPLPSMQGIQVLLNTPPVLTLRGAAVVSVFEGELYQSCPDLGDYAAGTACDLGAVATDAEDGDLTYRIKVCPFSLKGGQSLMSLVGVSNCGLSSTLPPGRYRLDFRVEDIAGLVATAYRTLVVQQRCDPGEALCANSLCSVGGSCADGSLPTPVPVLVTGAVLGSLAASDALAQGTDYTSPDAVPPAVVLFNNNTLNNTMTVVRGYDYQKCGRGQIPSADAPCELGVLAWDTRTGLNLTDRVYACPPVDCQASCDSCRGHEFGVKGVSGCVDTTQPVNTPIRLVFVVCDDSRPPNRGFAERVLTVVSPCSGATPYLCSGACYAVPCGSAASLNTTQPAEAPPTLTLTLSAAPFAWAPPPPPPAPPSPPPPYPPGGASHAAPPSPAAPPSSPSPSPSASLISTSTQNLTVYLQYGVPSAYSYMPCPDANTTTGCVATAVDASGADVTASITVVDVSPCANSDSSSDSSSGGTGCVRCTPARMTLGLCLYGNYTFQYTATSASGTASASLYITFVVEQYASLNATYQVATGLNLTQAQATQATLAANASAAQAAVLPAVTAITPPSAVRGLRVGAVAVVRTSATAWAVQITFQLTIGYVPAPLAAAAAATTGRRRARSVLSATPASSAPAFPLGASHAAPFLGGVTTPSWYLLSDPPTLTTAQSQQQQQQEGSGLGLTLTLGSAGGGGGGGSAATQLLSGALALHPAVRAQRAISQWVRRWALPMLEKTHQSALEALDQLGSLEHPSTTTSSTSDGSGSDGGGGGGDSGGGFSAPWAGAGRQLLQSGNSTAAYNTSCPDLTAASTATLSVGASVCSATVPDAAAVAMAQVFSVLADIEGLEASMSTSIQAMNTTINTLDTTFDTKDLAYSDALDMYNTALSKSYDTLSGFITRLPDRLLDKKASNSATIATEAAALLLNASRTLVIQMAQSIAVSALTALTGSPNSTAGNFSADPAYTAYIGCLNARAVGARWSFKLQRYTPPSGDYITALLSGGGAGTTVVASGGGTAEMGTTASAAAAMGGSGGAAAAPPARRLYTFSNDVAADVNGSGSGGGSNSTLIGSYNLTGDLTNASLIGYLSGYPIQQVPQGATLYIASGNSTVRRRTVGVKGNLLMGGAFLHQVRNPISRRTGELCDSAFADLSPDCDSSGANITYNFEDGGWFGMDPVFYNRSTLYKDRVAATPEHYYNMTACLNSKQQSCGQADRLGQPFGFQPLYVPNYDPGYPLVMHNRLSRSRLGQLMQYLQDGQYLDRHLTRQLSVELVTFNSDTRTFGYARMVFDWAGDGIISLSTYVQGLPAVDYSQYIDTRQYGLFVPDWFVVVLAVLYIVLTTVDVYKSFRSQGKTMDDNQAVGGIRLSPEELYLRKLKLKSEYRPRMDWYWVCFEYSLCILMAAAIALQFVYIFGLSPNAPLEMEYPVYDADVTAPAHFFMLQRNESAFQASTYNRLVSNGLDPTLGATAATSQPSGMPGPGEPYRWALPEDPTGLYDMANMYQSMKSMANIYAAYCLLQGIVLLLLLLRLIHYLSFQPRLSVVSGTLARMLPDLLHFILIFVMVACMFAMVAVLVYGYRVQAVATYGDAVIAVLKLLIVKTARNAAEGFGLQALIPAGAKLSVGESMLAYVVFMLAPVMFIYLFLNFFVAQILYPYIWMKTHNRDKPHVWDDWLFFIRCNWQTAWGKAPTNKRLDQLVDWLLMPKIGNNWWYNTLYRAIMQTTARRSAGAAARRGGRGKEMGIEILHAGHGHRFNFKRLAAELDDLFLDKPATEAQATRLLQNAQGVHFAKMRRLRTLLGIGGKAPAKELGKLEAGKPLSPLTKLRKSGKAGVVPAGDADEGDVAGRLARLLIDRYGQEMTKAQARNLDDVMARIRRRLNERASLSSGGSASSYLFYPPAAYGAPGPWGGPAGGYGGYGSYAYPSAYGGQPTPYYPFAAPPRASVDAASTAGSSRGGTPPLGTAAAAPLSTPPGSELLNQANMRRVLAQIGAELAQLAEADPTGQTDTEVLGREFAEMLAAATQPRTAANAERYVTHPDMALAVALYKAVNGNRTPTPGTPRGGGFGGIGAGALFAPGPEASGTGPAAAAGVQGRRVGARGAAGAGEEQQAGGGREVSFVTPFKAPDDADADGDAAAAGMQQQQRRRRASREMSRMGLELMAAATGRPIEELRREASERGDCDASDEDDNVDAADGDGENGGNGAAGPGLLFRPVIPPTGAEVAPVPPEASTSAAAAAAAAGRENAGTPEPGAVRRAVAQDAGLKPWHRRPSGVAVAEAAHGVVARLISHAVHLSKELKGVQGEVNSMLASTQSVLDAILSRRFVPRAIQRSVNLPGTPTGSRRDLGPLFAPQSPRAAAGAGAGLQGVGSRPGSFSAAAWPARRPGEAPPSPRTASRLSADLQRGPGSRRAPLVQFAGEMQMQDVEDEDNQLQQEQEEEDLVSSRLATAGMVASQAWEGGDRCPGGGPRAPAATMSPSKDSQTGDEERHGEEEEVERAELQPPPIEAMSVRSASMLPGDEEQGVSQVASVAELQRMAQALDEREDEEGQALLRLQRQREAAEEAEGAGAPAVKLKKKKKKVAVAEAGAQAGAEGGEASGAVAPADAPVKKKKKKKVVMEEGVDAGAATEGAVTEGAETAAEGEAAPVRKVKKVVKKKKKQVVEEGGVDAGAATDGAVTEGAVTEGAETAAEGDEAPVRKVKKVKKKEAVVEGEGSVEAAAGEASTSAVPPPPAALGEGEVEDAPPVKRLVKKKKKVGTQPEAAEAEGAEVMPPVVVVAEAEADGATEGGAAKKVVKKKKKKAVEGEPEGGIAAGAEAEAGGGGGGGAGPSGTAGAAAAVTVEEEVGEAVTKVKKVKKKAAAADGEAAAEEQVAEAGSAAVAPLPPPPPRAWGRSALITPPGPPRLAFQALDGDADGGAGPSGDGGGRNVGALAAEAAERAALPTGPPRGTLAPGGPSGAAAAAGDPALRGFTRVRGPRPSPSQPAPGHEHERPHTRQ